MWASSHAMHDPPSLPARVPDSSPNRSHLTIRFEARILVRCPTYGPTRFKAASVPVSFHELDPGFPASLTHSGGAVFSRA